MCDDIRLFKDRLGLFWGRVEGIWVTEIKERGLSGYRMRLEDVTEVKDGQEVIVTFSFSISLCQTVETQPGMGQKEIEAAAWAAMLEERGAIEFKDCGIDKVEFDLGVPQATI